MNDILSLYVQLNETHVGSMMISFSGIIASCYLLFISKCLLHLRS